MNSSLLATTPLVLTPIEVIVNLFMATFFGVLSAVVYKRTHKGVSYSQSFVLSLVLVTIITSMVIMVIGNSLTRAFGLIGAFALIRFRTAVKDARDIAFLFLTLVLGMAVGSGAYQIAILGFITVITVVYALDRIKFGAMNAYEYVLTFMLSTKNTENSPYKEIFERYLKESLLLNVRSIDEGKSLELSFNVRLKSDVQLSEFTKQLSAIKSVSRVELLSTAGDVEY